MSLLSMVLIVSLTPFAWSDHGDVADCENTSGTVSQVTRDISVISEKIGPYQSLPSGITRMPSGDYQFPERWLTERVPEKITTDGVKYGRGDARIGFFGAGVFAPVFFDRDTKTIIRWDGVTLAHGSLPARRGSLRSVTVFDATDPKYSVVTSQPRIMYVMTQAPADDRPMMTAPGYIGMRTFFRWSGIEITPTDQDDEFERSRKGLEPFSKEIHDLREVEIDPPIRLVAKSIGKDKKIDSVSPVFFDHTKSVSFEWDHTEIDVSRVPEAVLKSRLVPRGRIISTIMIARPKNGDKRLQVELDIAQE